MMDLKVGINVFDTKEYKGKQYQIALEVKTLSPCDAVFSMKELDMNNVIMGIVKEVPVGGAALQAEYPNDQDQYNAALAQVNDAWVTHVGYISDPVVNPAPAPTYDDKLLDRFSKTVIVVAKDGKLTASPMVISVEQPNTV
jgi:hypothetical protein